MVDDRLTRRPNMRTNNGDRRNVDTIVAMYIPGKMRTTRTQIRLRSINYHGSHW